MVVRVPSSAAVFFSRICAESAVYTSSGWGPTGGCCLRANMGVESAHRRSLFSQMKQVNAAQAEPLDRRLGREIVVLLSRIVQVVKDFRFKR